MCKKIVVAITLVSVFLSGCSFFEDEGSYSSVIFNFVADTKVEEDSSNVTITFNPDEELRSLEVLYSIVFPNKGDGSGYEDIEAEGYLGGAQYDYFEEIITLLNSEDFEYEKHEYPNFFVTLVEEDGDKETFELYWHDTSEDFEKIKAYYTDVVAFFTEDV